MEDQKIIILNELLDAFEKKDFDLESWKIKALLILKKIFGSNDDKLKIVEKLQYDYSSWALRDHSGGRQHDPVKDKAREIIESAILELKLSDTDSFNAVLKENLTGAQYKNLLKMFENEMPKQKTVQAFFEKLKPEIKNTIFSQLAFNSLGKSSS